jgi:hypothetical protein
VGAEQRISHRSRSPRNHPCWKLPSQRPSTVFGPTFRQRRSLHSD